MNEEIIVRLAWHPS